MPATLLAAPPGISCVFSDGTAVRFDLDGLPCPDLVGDLLTGLAELVRPHGTVDAAGSAGHYVQSIRDMARKLTGQGFTGRAADLRRTLLAEYWMAASSPREACARRLLLGFTASGGCLDAKVAVLIASQAYNPQRNHRQLPPYRESESDGLTSACRRIADESFAAHKRALAAAERGRRPAGGEWNAENLRWLLTRTGPVGLAQPRAAPGLLSRCGAPAWRGHRGEQRPVPGPGRGDRLPAVVRRLLGNRPRRH